MGGRTESLFGSGARFQMPFGGGLGWWLHPLCRERTARAALFQMAGVWGCLPCRWGLSSVVDAPDFRGGALHPCPWCWVCAALARRRVWPSFGVQSGLVARCSGLGAGAFPAGLLNRHGQPPKPPLPSPCAPSRPALLHPSVRPAPRCSGQHTPNTKGRAATAPPLQSVASTTEESPQRQGKHPQTPAIREPPCALCKGDAATTQAHPQKASESPQKALCAPTHQATPKADTTRHAFVFSGCI